MVADDEIVKIEPRRSGVGRSLTSALKPGSGRRGCCVPEHLPEGRLKPGRTGQHRKSIWSP